MGNLLSPQFKEDKKALRDALRCRDASKVSLVLGKYLTDKDASLLLARMDKGTGDTALHMGVSIGDHASIQALIGVLRG